MVTPSDLLLAAREISQNSNSESTIRAAISRYYYAACHCGHQFHAALPNAGSQGNARGRHNQLISKLANPSPQLSKFRQADSLVVGTALLAIRNLRIPADYYLNTTMSGKELGKAAQLAAAIFALA